jgi:Cu2+-exporting ATPase
MQIAARRGILFVAPEKIEALADAQNFFFDKTGTLTTGQFTVTSWSDMAGDHGETKWAARALESLSLHPVGKAIARYLGPAPVPADLSNYREIPGLGAEGTLGGSRWRAVRGAEAVAGRNVVDIWCGDTLRARIELGDSLREETAEVVRAIHREGARTEILSGDTEGNVAAVARALGIARWQSGLTPEEKARILADRARSVMVGDGANDAAAFRGATVGVAVQGAVEQSIHHADILLTKPGLPSFLAAWRLARETMRIVRRNFAVTLAYNLLAGALALSGLMQPLWAARLMPLSALSVFCLTEWRMRRIRS